MTALQQAIAAEYAVREADAGGLANADPQQIANGIAADWNLPVEEVNEAIRAAQVGMIGVG